jgi:hypothetical protein
VALFRDDAEFAAGITEAASRLRVTRAFVEKDYWVTQVLRALHLVFPGQFLLKGGTSLSKGYAIIDRFSEDLDILVVPRNDHSASTAEARLRAMVTGTAAALELPWEELRTPGRGVTASRGDLIRYVLTEGAPGSSTGIRLGEVLLETGFSGGPEPSEMCEVTTLVGRALEIPPGDYEDLVSFDLRMLDPRRTLIEKCAALHHLASIWTEEKLPANTRFGRHYYDIYQLLGHQRTVEGLADREEFRVIVEDVARISANHFGAVTPRPEEGFAVSKAFRPDSGSPLRAWLEAGYRESHALIPRASEPPTFGRILARIAASASLL